MAAQFDQLAQQFRDADQHLTPIPNMPELGSGYRTEVTLALIKRAQTLAVDMAQPVIIAEIKAGSISQRRAAEILGIHQTTIGRWIRGDEAQSEPAKAHEKLTAASINFMYDALAEPGGLRKLLDSVAEENPDGDALQFIKDRLEEAGYDPADVAERIQHAQNMPRRSSQR